MTKRIFAIFLVLVSLFSCLALPASAATCSYGTKTRTITVVTKSKWYCPGAESITLSQSKGSFSYSKTNWYGKVIGTKNKNGYGTWNISVSATDGSHSYSKTWNDGSIKLTLKPNKTYKITLSYNSYQDIIRGINYYNFRWTRYPSWRVKSTWKVSNFY